MTGKHLSTWKTLQFAENPIDLGLDLEECWDRLRNQNPDISNLIPKEAPQVDDSFFHQASPKPYPNQEAIISCMTELARVKNSIIYVAWPCGAGKTACMLEAAHSVALSNSRKGMSLKLVLSNNELVNYYQELF